MSRAVVTFTAMKSIRDPNEPEKIIGTNHVNLTKVIDDSNTTLGLLQDLLDSHGVSTCHLVFETP